MSASTASVRFERFGTPEVLQLVHDPTPEPGAGEVRIRVEASSVQFTDTLIRRGLYPDLQGKPPFVPGYDVLGTIDAVGDEVTGWQVGDRVADLCMTGGNAQYTVRPAAGLVAVPMGVDAAQAVTLVLSWVTAQQVLFREAKLVSGERLLIIGGNGAVGRAAIELAMRAGAQVYATASDRHHDDLRRLGATPLPRDGWQATLRELGGVDVAVDGVAADGFKSSWQALKTGGRLVAIGLSAPAATGSKLQLVGALLRYAMYKVLPGGSASFYSISARRKSHPAEFAADLQALLSLLESGELTPEVGERLTLAQVADAHARLQAGGLAGKLVLDPWAQGPAQE